MRCLQLLSGDLGGGGGGVGDGVGVGGANQNAARPPIDSIACLAMLRGCAHATPSTRAPAAAAASWLWDRMRGWGIARDSACRAHMIRAAGDRDLAIEIFEDAPAPRSHLLWSAMLEVDEEYALDRLNPGEPRRSRREVAP